MQLIPAMRSVFDLAINLIYPPVCHICESVMDVDRQICQACMDNFSLQQEPHDSFSVAGDIHIDQAWALFEFDEGFQKLIHNLKYAAKRKAVLEVLNHLPRLAIMDFFDDARFTDDQVSEDGELRIG